MSATIVILGGSCRAAPCDGSQASQLGRTIYCFSPLVAYTTSSGTMEAREEAFSSDPAQIFCFPCLKSTVSSAPDRSLSNFSPHQFQLVCFSGSSKGGEMVGGSG